MSRKNKKRRSNSWRRHASKPIFVLLSAVMMGCLVSAPFVSADNITDQINSLENQNAQNQQAVNSLESQATSYQDAINQLQGQIAGLQASIAANQAQQISLQQQIAEAQSELDHEKQVLGSDIKAMYVDGQITTIEELATSKSLSDFVDAETYRNAVQSQVQTTLTKITQLQNQLKDQQDQVQQLLNIEQQQQNQLTSSEAQQQQLLSYNQTQQDSFNQQTAANAAKIAQLEAEELAAHQHLIGSGNVTVISSGSCGGGYPAAALSPNGGDWGCNYPLDNTVDNWGMYNRECVSYTAWKVSQAYPGLMPAWGFSGVGNADEWPGDAQADGIPIGSTPRVDSVAIGTDASYFGPVGHAMWVEEVSGSEILVSQYNFSGPGVYSEMWIPASLISTFIYFGS